MNAACVVFLVSKDGHELIGISSFELTQKMSDRFGKSNKA